MGNLNGWLKARERHKVLLAKIQKILGGGILAALIIGPLVYFSVCAEPSATPVSERFGAQVSLTEKPATPEVKTSDKLIEFPTKKTKEEFEEGGVDLDIELKKLPASLEGKREEVTKSLEEDLSEVKRNQLEKSFNKTDIEVKTITKDVGGFEEQILITENLDIDFGPRVVEKEDDADSISRNVLNKYIQTLPNSDKIAIFKDTTKLKQSNKKVQIVLSDIKHHANKWYVTFQQYQDALPVYDGTLKMIFTDEKRLLVLSDNLKYEIPDTAEFVVSQSVATEKAKEVFDWNEEIDEIEFVDKGYYKNKPTYKVDTNAHNPLGDWQVYVNGVDGEIENLYGDIRLQDTPPEEPVEEVVPAAAGPFPESEAAASLPEPILVEPETPPADESVEAPAPAEPAEELLEETPASPDVTTAEIIETLEELAATEEPEIIIIDTFFSQVLGKIFPKTPADTQEIEPFANEYVYIDTTQVITDEGGYFENPNKKWYSVFLDGPYVTVHDDDATSNAEIKDKTPEDPFTWDENSASLAAINAFYHTNKIREYFAETHGYEMDDNIPLTVNSELVDQYIEGCGAWFNNTEKTIEMGRGGTEFCPDDLNYALSSDLVYHEYTHFIVEDITHLPNISGAESAALGEGLADYFASSINNDSVWGDVVAPNSTRNLDNTLNYQMDMTGESHHDGQIFAGALWDLREAIGAEATDRLVFNTLYQDRLHFETFMYGMIIEDDDNNDFSDGTPNLVHIIHAFELHGIGPGLANFNGLPITPEAWALLLEEAGYEGEEEPLLEAGISGTCSWSGDPGSVLYSGSGYCYISGGGTLTATGFISSSGSTTYVYQDTTFQVDGQSLINGTVQLGSTTTYGIYDAMIADANTEQIILASGGYLNVLYMTSRVEVENLDMTGGTLGISTDPTINNQANELDMSSGTATIRSGGFLDVNGITYVDNGATLDIDSGGLFDTNTLYQGDADGSPTGGYVAVQGDLDVLGSAYLFDGGNMTVSSPDGNVTISTHFYIGDTDDNPTGGHVENSDYISVAGTTYLMYNSDANEGDVDNNSGAQFYTQNLYIGQSGYSGGNFENDGYMNVSNITDIYAGQLNIDTAGLNSITNYLRLYNGGNVNIASGAEVNQDYASGYVSLADDCDLDNYGTLDVDGYLSLSGGSSGTVRPELYNGSTGTVELASYGTMSGYGDIQTLNDFLVTTNLTANGSSTIRNYELLDVNGTLYLYDSAVLTNNSAGNLQVYEDFYMGNSTGDSASVNNYGGITVSGSTSNYLFVYYNTTFTNQSTGTVTVDNASTSSSDGKIYMHSVSSTTSDTPVFNNYGIINTASLQIGFSNSGTSFDTVFTNYSGGTVNVDYNGTAFYPFQIQIEGTFNNNSGATLDVDGRMNLTGGATTSDDAFLNNASTSCTVDGYSYIGEYAHLTNSGTCIIYNSMEVNTSDGSYAYTINNSSQFTILDYLTVSNYSTVYNSSYFYVYDGATMNNNAIIYNINGRFTVDNLVNTTPYLTMNNNTRVYNTDVAGSAMNTTLDVAGTTYVYDTSSIANNNDGTPDYDEVTFETYRLIIGYYNSGVDYREGGGMSIGGEADIDVLSTGTDAMEVYNGGTSILYVSGDTTKDFDVAGTATFRGAADWTTDYAWFNNYQQDASGNTVSFGGLILEAYAKFDAYASNLSTTVVNGNVQIDGGQFDARQYSLLDVSGNLTVEGTAGDENGRLYIYNSLSDVDVDGYATVGDNGLMDIRGDIWVAGDFTAIGSNAHLLATYPVNRNDGVHTTYGRLAIWNGGDVDLNNGSDGTRFDSLEMQASTGATSLYVGTSVTLSLTSYHTGTASFCATGKCSIEMNTEHSITYDSIIGLAGEIDVADTADNASMVVSSSAIVSGTAEIAITADGTLDVNETAGRMYIEYEGLLDVNSAIAPLPVADIEMDVEVQSGGTIQVGGALSQTGAVDINANLWNAGNVNLNRASATLDVSGTIYTENGGILENEAGIVNGTYTTGNMFIYNGGIVRGDNSGGIYDSQFYFNGLDCRGTATFMYHVDGITAFARDTGTINFGSDSYAGSTPTHSIGRVGSPGYIWAEDSGTNINIYSNISFETSTSTNTLRADNSGTININDTSTVGVYSYLDLEYGDIYTDVSGSIVVNGRIVNAGDVYMGDKSSIYFYNPDSSVGYYNTLSTIEMQAPTSGIIGQYTLIDVNANADVRVTSSRTCGSYTCSLEIGTDNPGGILTAKIDVNTDGFFRTEMATNDVIFGVWGFIEVDTSGYARFGENDSASRVRASGTLTANGTLDIYQPLLVLSDGRVNAGTGGTVTVNYCTVIGDNGEVYVFNGGTFQTNTGPLTCPQTVEGASATDGLTILSGVTTDGKFTGANSDTSDIDVMGDMSVYGDLDLTTTMWVNDGDILNKNGGEIFVRADSSAHLRGTENYDHENGAYLEVGSDLLGNGVGNMTLWGTATFDGEALIVGNFECATNLTINSNAVGLDKVTVDGNWTIDKGTITVTGSTTDIYGELELDGTLNAGDLTVYSGGRIHSGEGNYLDADDGSYFLINADSLTINTGGLIGNTSAQAQSQYNCSTFIGAGSHGGEGANRGMITGGRTYDRTKLTSADYPKFGEASADASLKCDSYGGGGVRIVVDGNIDIDGDIRADGSCTGPQDYACGAGGTIIIDHNITHSDTTVTFTGDGYITANGGSTTTASEYPGGGGRISINSILLDYPDDGGTTAPSYLFPESRIEAYGGGNSTSSYYAAAGTIMFLGDDNNDEGSLLLKQGGNVPTGTPTPQTWINDTGTSDDYEANRVEASGNARVEYETAPTVPPYSCYELSSATVSGLASCEPYPDKPHILFVNNSYAGAQSGTEPYVGGPVDPQDLTPNFSIIYVNPEVSTPADRVTIQVDNEPNFALPLIWVFTSDPGITAADGSALDPGERSRDIVFNENGTALSNLTTGTTYYVRARFRDASSNSGPWSHMDMGNHYNFEINDYMSLSDGCSGAMDINDTNAAGRPAGNNLKDTDGDRYGFDACTITADSTFSTSQILYGMAPGETGFTDGTYVFDPVADCTIDTDGTSPPASEEEYGFVLKNVEGSFTVSNDTECGSQPFNSWAVIADGEYQYLHDIEASGSEDQILTTSSVITSKTFDLEVHAGIDTYTIPTTYDLETRLIITTNP